MSIWRKLFSKKYGDRGRGGEINPEEIFLDASNLPSFNTDQFEGKMERPIKKTALFLMVGVYAVLVVALISRLWFLQVALGEEYSSRAENNRLMHQPIFAERGVMYDRNGVELAWNESKDDVFAQRVYTTEKGFAHILGYTRAPARDSSGFFYEFAHQGVAGAERLFDGALRGENGKKIIETTALFELRGESVILPPKDGKNITLSIDARVQNALYGYIESLVHERGFQGGGGALIDVETGELLALTSYPEYDPNALSQPSIESGVLSAYQNDSRTPFLNRIISGLYTPGSIIKPFVATGVMEEGVIGEYTTVYSGGRMVVPNPYNPSDPSVFTDWKAHGSVAMRDALAVSSNIYFYQTTGGFEGQRGIGIDNIDKYTRLFGFGVPTGFSLADERAGVIPNPVWKEKTFNDVWRVGDTYLTAIGQYGFQVTPLQTLRATAALADGKIRPVRIEKILDGENVTPGKTLPLSDHTLSVVREGMRAAVTRGTAGGLSVPYVTVAAKTGTAELGARKEEVNSWIIGYFPYEKPRYAFVVLMERGPRANTVGGVFVMRQLLDWMRRETPEYLGL